MIIFKFLFLFSSKDSFSNSIFKKINFIVPNYLSHGRNSYPQRIPLLKSKFEIEEISKKHKK